MSTKNDINTATILHLSALSQCIVPLGNFIFPIIIWSGTKEKSVYVDNQGRQCINFHLSVFIYMLVLALIAVPVFIIAILNGIEFHHFANGNFIADEFNQGNIPTLVAIAIITVVLFGMLTVTEFFLIIYAAVQTSNGRDFKYPFTIPFLKYKTIDTREADIDQEAEPGVAAKDQSPSDENSK